MVCRGVILGGLIVLLLFEVVEFIVCFWLFVLCKRFLMLFCSELFCFCILEFFDCLVGEGNVYMLKVLDGIEGL